MPSVLFAALFAASVPALPPELSLADLDEGLSNGCRIVTTGVVTEISDDEIDADYRRLMLRDGNKVIPAFVHIGHISLPPDLEERRIRLTGTYHVRTDGGRKFSDPFINVANLQDNPIVIRIISIKAEEDITFLPYRKQLGIGLVAIIDTGLRHGGCNPQPGLIRILRIIRILYFVIVARCR